MPEEGKGWKGVRSLSDPLPRWMISRTGESVCEARGDSFSQRYVELYVWESIYRDSFWQVQRRHLHRDLEELQQVEDYHPLVDSPPITCREPPTPLCTCGEADCILCLENAMPFRVLSTCSAVDLVVAMAQSSAAIMNDQLSYLRQNLSPLLQMMAGQRSLTNSDPSITPPASGTIRLNFMTLKLCALIKQQTEEQYAASSLSRFPSGTLALLRHFHPEVTRSDIRYHTQCAVWGDRYFKGALFLSQIHLYFLSITCELMLSIRLDSLVRFEMATTVEFQQPCIQLVPHPVQIFEIDEIEEAFEELTKAWKMSMKSQMIRGHTKNRKLLAMRHASLGHVMDSPEKSVQERSLNRTERELTFHANPFSPTLSHGRCAGSFSIDAITNPSLEYVRGLLRISYNGFHFCRLEEGISLAIPFRSVEDISALNIENLRVVLRNPKWRCVLELYSLDEKQHTLLQQNFFLYKLTKRLSHIAQPIAVSGSPNVVSPSTSLRKGVTSPLAGLKWLLSSSSKQHRRKWKEYFYRCGSVPCMVRTPELARLIREGIPEKYRTTIWEFLSGAVFKSQREHEDYRYFLHTCPRGSHISNEIERDLNRTLPLHPSFKPQTGSKLESLRNVLLAYSVKNSSVGYCQGMNVVVAFLLLYLEEEPAFNLLSHISERIVPGYFQESLAGIKLDQIVMQSLVETHLPKVAAHLQRYMGGCLLVCFEWFMCFFGRCLPVDIVVRVFDWLLLDESRALFVTALAILSIFEEEILRFEAAPSLIETLKKEMLNVQPEPLFHAMLHYESLITDQQLELLRSRESSLGGEFL